MDLINPTRGILVSGFEQYQYLRPSLEFDQKRIIGELKEKYIESVEDNERLKAKLERLEPQVIVVEEVPFKVAKEKILDYLQNNDGAYTSAIAYDLKLPIKTVLKVISSLKEDGKLA